MSEDVAVTDTQHLQLTVRVLAHADQPGIAKILVGDQVLFDGDAANVIDASVKVLIPFHLHFEALRLGCAWRANGS